MNRLGYQRKTGDN